MRVISGYLKSRIFESPHGHRTHPMSEKVRGGLFNALGDIAGYRVLDAFAGSGALAIEAISRGVAHVTAIDIDKRAITTIVKNCRSLEIGSSILRPIRANASSWSDRNPDSRYDIVLVAPPYDALQVALVHKLTLHVQDEGLFVLDWPGKQEVPVFQGFKQLSVKNYGDAQLAFYRKTK